MVLFFYYTCLLFFVVWHITDILCIEVPLIPHYFNFIFIYVLFLCFLPIFV